MLGIERHEAARHGAAFPARVRGCECGYGVDPIYVVEALMTVGEIEENNPYTSQYVSWKGWGTLFTGSPREIRTFEKEFSGVSLNGKRVLEIGFGAGSFMSWAQRKGAKLSGCELIEELCVAGVAKGFDTRHGGIELFSNEVGAFDLIVAFDVMEHIDANKSADFMRAVRRLLKEDGLFMVRVPNGASPWGMAYQQGDISHVHALSAGKFQQLADRSELKMLYCRNAARLANSSSKFLDYIKFRCRDVVERLINSIYGLSSVPMDPNIMACFTPKGRVDD